MKNEIIEPWDIKASDNKGIKPKRLPKFYDRYTDEKFVDAQEFEDFLRRGQTLKYDYMILGGVLYTMHEYDMDGKQVTWANKKYNTMVEVNTSNRYGERGYTDAEVLFINDPWGLRMDINYAE